jgi:hypothetical protein
MRAGGDLPLSELATPDLDLIKQEEQECATAPYDKYKPRDAREKQSLLLLP